LWTGPRSGPGHALGIADLLDQAGDHPRAAVPEHVLEVVHEREVGLVPRGDEEAHAEAVIDGPVDEASAQAT
jgi:hypothetical protein